VTGPTLLVVRTPGTAGPRDVIRAGHGRYEIVFVGEPDPLLERMAPVVRPPADAAGLMALRRREPAGIVAFSDAAVPPAADLAQRLGLPFHTPRTARLLTGKVEQRRALNAAGVSVTRFEAVGERTALPAAAARIGFPAVVKPAVSDSSRWTQRCDSAADVRRFAAAAAADPGSPAEWIVEEMLAPGAHPYGDVLADFVSVESVVQDGVPTHFAVTDRLAMAPPFRERGLLTPSLLAPAECGPLRDLTTAALAALGVRSGLTHTEIKLTPDGPRIIEVNGRLGGWIGDLMRRVTDVDPVRWAMDVAAGRAVEAEAIAFREHAAVLLVQPPEGRHRVVEMAGPQLFRREPGVWQAWMRARPGDLVDSRAGSLQALYAVFVEADRGSMAARLRRLDAVARTAAVLEAPS
jgi:biotin carboxylase